MATNSSETLLTSPYIELNNRGKLLRFDLCEDEHRLGRDRTWANLPIPEQGWEVISGRHILFKREGDRYRAYDGDGKGKPSTNGLFMNHTRIKPQPGCLLLRQYPTANRSKSSEHDFDGLHRTAQSAGNQQQAEHVATELKNAAIAQSGARP